MECILFDGKTTLHKLVELLEKTGFKGNAKRHIYELHYVIYFTVTITYFRPEATNVWEERFVYIFTDTVAVIVIQVFHRLGILR